MDGWNIREGSIKEEAAMKKLINVVLLIFGEVLIN